MSASHRQRIEQCVARELELELRLAAAKEATGAAIVDALKAGATYRGVGHLIGVEGSTVQRRYGAKNIHAGGDVLDHPIGETR